MSGPEFNKIADPRFSATTVDFERMERDGGLWDCRIPGSTMEFLVELAGEVIIIWLPFNYSRLLNPDSNLKAELLEWETPLTKLVPNVAVFRVDEFLLEDFDLTENYDWHWHREKIDAFLAWLTKQDPLHWQQIQ
jgi:hypothetical protein